MRQAASRAALIVTLLGSVTLAQQPSATLPDTAQRELQIVQELLVRASAEFDGPQQGRSIALFDQIIEKLEALYHQGLLPPRGREILVQAYEYRGRAYYNIGLPEKASDSFRSLIQLSPQHALSKEKVSPKVVDFFASVKKALVGYLAVSSKPPGARVTLNGEFLSLTDFFPLEVLAGEYTVEVSREGYQSEVRTLSIAPKATEVLEIPLLRVAASFFFTTEPAGVEVWIDGELKATTAPALAPDQQAEAHGKGLDPSRASARTEVANLSLGQHVVEFRKKCFEPVKITLDAREALDYEAEPVRLEDSLASLQLSSDPPGARIFIDGEPMGLTPKEIDGVCSGRHRIEVKHAAGKFVQDVTLARNEGLSLNCPIRPTLAFLGVVAETAAGERTAPEAEEMLLRQLAKITTLNVVPAPREVVDRSLDAERLTRRGLIPGAGTDPDLIRKVTEKLASALEVQGFLIALLPEERLQRTAILHLLAAGNTVSDRWDVTFSESASYLRFIAAVDQKATVYRPWTGLVTVDVPEIEGVPVLRVVPGSPAAQAGIQQGDILQAIDGRPARATAELLAAVEGRKPKERLALRLKSPSGERAVDLAVGETPQEVPLNEASLLYNKVMVDLRQEVDGYPGSEGAAFARLNLALCAMHFGDYAAAHEHLLKARSELPQRPGLSQGTALYYLGLAFERLGDRYRREAAEAYRAAAAAKDATLWNNDGPPVALLAARRIQP
jgi:tetratricopeptide (TPR) repeat protein